MADSTATEPRLCEHVVEADSPFEVTYVLEAYLGFASALTRCRQCGADYLLELIDIAAEQRAYRVASLSPGHAARLIRTLTRGTCDMQRAGQEVQHLQNRSTVLPVVLCLDGSEVTRIVPTDVVPSGHWRELPCDGAWFSE